MKKNNIIAFIVVLLTMLSVYRLYESEYNIKNNNQDIERAIMEFTTPFENSSGVENPIVIDKIRVDDSLLVFYGDKKIDELLGFTPLHRGLNGKYQIRRTNYGPSNIYISGYSFKVSRKNYIAIGGKNYSERIKLYKVFNWNDELIFEENINGDRFLKVYETDEEIFPKITVFDEDGIDITRELWNNFQNTPSAGVGKAELFMLNVFIIIILFIGFIISKHFWDMERKG